MAKSLIKELGGRYERQGDYLVPCLAVSAEEEQSIGIWGQRHLDDLKQCRRMNSIRACAREVVNEEIIYT